MTRLPSIRQRVAHHRQLEVEELRLVDPDHLGVCGHGVEQRTRARHAARGQADIAVRDDVIVSMAVIELWLEHLHPLPRNLGAAQPADQLLALSAEHAAGDHLDPALVAASG